MEDKERARALELTLGQIEKQFGKGSILRLGSKEAIIQVAAISWSVLGTVGMKVFPCTRRVPPIGALGVFGVLGAT